MLDVHDHEKNYKEKRLEKVHKNRQQRVQFYVTLCCVGWYTATDNRYNNNNNNNNNRVQERAILMEVIIGQEGQTPNCFH